MPFVPAKGPLGTPLLAPALALSGGSQAVDLPLAQDPLLIAESLPSPLGSPVNLHLQGTTASLHLLAFSLQPCVPTSLQGIAGARRLDPANLWLLGAFPIDASGNHLLKLFHPSDPTLAGAIFSLQAAELAPAGLALGPLAVLALLP